jgi:hypothetical protein
LNVNAVLSRQTLQNVPDSVLAHLNQQRSAMADAEIVEEDQAHSLDELTGGKLEGSEMLQHVVDEGDGDFVVEVEVAAASLGGDVDVGAWGRGG